MNIFGIFKKNVCYNKNKSENSVYIYLIMNISGIFKKNVCYNKNKSENSVYIYYVILIKCNDKLFYKFSVFNLI